MVIAAIAIGKGNKIGWILLQASDTG